MKCPCKNCIVDPICIESCVQFVIYTENLDSYNFNFLDSSEIVYPAGFSFNSEITISFGFFILFFPFY